MVDTTASLHIDRREEPSSAADPGGTTRPLPFSLLTSGWIPAAVAGCATVATVRFFGVPLRDAGLFLLHLTLVVTVPGMLLWRWGHRGSRSMVEDVAAGTALGFAIEVLTYIAGRALGVPLLVLVPPTVVLAGFAAIPRLRSYWRGAGPARRAPAIWSWTMAGAWLVILFWSFRYMRYHGLQWPGYGQPDMDMPFHLALLGEAKHHMPLMTPWVTDEPMLYHWFVYAEMAATSWVTGIEPLVLLTRLGPLPMLAAFMLMVAAIARRVTASWWVAAVSVLLTFFVLAPSPYGWLPMEHFSHFGFSPFDDGSVLRLTLWTSPTQTFGALLFTPALAVLLDLFTGHPRDLRRWLLFAVMSAGVMGAKAVYLPLLLGALMIVIAGWLVARRGLHRPSLIAGAIVSVCLLFAQFVLFGGASQGLKLDPLAVMDSSPAGVSTGFVYDPPPWGLVMLTVLIVLCWICIWGGVAGLGRRVLEPQMMLLLALGVTGMGAILALGHEGGSQVFFLQSARPYLAIAAATGLALLIGRSGRRSTMALLGMAALGMVAQRVVKFVDGSERPEGSARQLALQLVWPYAALLLFAVLVGFVLWRLRQRIAAPTVVALVVAMLAGFGLMSTYSQLNKLVRESREEGWREVVVGTSATNVTHGTIEAGRWLRDHSSPDDLVATNAHCHLGWIGPEGRCANLHFSVSAYTERRVLVEGWAFTATTHVQAAKEQVSVYHVGYWRPELLADNDAAFTSPSAETVSRLRDKYGVRWMFVDLAQGRPPDRLQDFATLRYRAGDCLVYEIT